MRFIQNEWSEFHQTHLTHLLSCLDFKLISLYGMPCLVLSWLGMFMELNKKIITKCTQQRKNLTINSWKSYRTRKTTLKLFMTKQRVFQISIVACELDRCFMIRCFTIANPENTSAWLYLIYKSGFYLEFLFWLPDLQVCVVFCGHRPDVKPKFFKPFWTKKCFSC